MSIPVPNTCKIALGWTFQVSGQQCLNTFYLEDASGAIFTNPSATLSAIQGTIAATLAAQTDNVIAFNLLEFEDQRTVPYGGISQSITPAIVGALATANLMPSSVALAVKKNTASLSRSGRGRWYWPVMNSAHLSSADTIASAYAASVVSALGAFQTAVQAALPSATMGIVSRQNNKIPRATGLFEAILSWSVVDFNVDSQRRRLVGRGR